MTIFSNEAAEKHALSGFAQKCRKPNQQRRIHKRNLNPCWICLLLLFKNYCEDQLERKRGNKEGEK